MKQEAILYFGNEWFGENKTSSHHIAQRLSKERNLIYIECPGLRAPRMSSGRDLKRIFVKLQDVFSKPRISHEKFPVYTLLQIPAHGNKLFTMLNKFLCSYQVKRICKKEKIYKPTLWFLVPHVAFLINQIKASKLVYYCTDDYSSFPGVDYDAVKKMDDYVTKSVDLVFVTSNKLLEDKKCMAKRIQYSPHGVDFDHFNSVQKANLEIPEDMKNIEKPIIGFFGLIEHWIDIQLIKYLAENNRSWNIVLIGQCAADVESISDLENVHLLGKKEYIDLPNYASLFDVAILPYIDSYQIKYCSPLKLREYLATGVPVVSVDFPEIKGFADIIGIATSYSSFEECVQKALNEDSNEARDQRVNSVRSSTWESTSDKVFNAYKELS